MTDAVGSEYAQEIFHLCISLLSRDGGSRLPKMTAGGKM